MKRRRSLLGLGAALGMAILILDGKTALAGAVQGLELCIRTVIPSLFPFFLLSIALTSSLSGVRIPLFHSLGRLCRIPQGSESLLLTGFLGGYPVGAQGVSEAYSAGLLSRRQAQRMLSFCSNAGPSFIFGMIAAQFPDLRYPWLIWGIHMVSAVLVAISLPGLPSESVRPTAGKSVSVSDIMKKSISTMATVCGWVIVFRVILAFLDLWIFWAVSKPICVTISGVLELANGCCSLQQIEHIGLRFLLCTAFLSFGGICVLMQTSSVIGDLGIAHYLTGKLLQTGYSLVLALVCQPLLPQQVRLPNSLSLGAAAAGIMSVLLTLAVKRQKNSSNPLPLGV